VVDRYWLAEHVAAFDDEGRVACTTGLAVPSELATPAQLWFRRVRGIYTRLRPTSD